MSINRADSKRIALAIQLERKRKEGWKSFNFIDEILLRIICDLIEFKIAQEFYHAKLASYETRDMNITKTLTDLLTARSQATLLKLMRQSLPKYHGFEDLGLLFYSPGSKKLYTLLDPDNEESNQIIWLSSDVGLSGEIIQDHEIKVQNPETSKKFNTEVDAVHGMKRIKNFMYGPLFQDYPQNNQLIGIMQFVNKVGGGEVDDKDIGLYKKMSGLYGLLMLKAMEKQNILNTLVQIKESTSTITQVLPKKAEENADKSISNISAVLRTFGGIINDMCSEKRDEVLKDLSHMVHLK